MQELRSAGRRLRDVWHWDLGLAGARVALARRQRLPAPPLLGRCHARQDGFDLHAAVRVPAGVRDRLERLSRYALRPPVAQDRLRLTPGGEVELRLAHPWVDGTTHLRFHPVELLERLAVLIPRPRINLILYHGVLAPRASLRSRVVRYGKGGLGAPAPASESEAAAAAVAGEGERGPAGPAGPGRSSGRGRLWADLMRRSFGLDLLFCPRCGARLRLIALIEEPAVVARILGHLGLTTAIAAPRPARAPPPALVNEAASGGLSDRRAQVPAIDDDALFDIHARV